MQPPYQTHSGEWLVITRLTIAAFFLVGAGAAFAQCAPGIPSAGNPRCIPPNQQNSPYYEGQANAEAPAPEQPRVVWANRWGSIAMDDNGAAGTVVDQTSESAARKEALARCEENGGKKCETVLSYHNQCAAVAQMPSGGPVFASRAPTQAEAESNSVSNCGQKGCSVVYSRCSLPHRCGPSAVRPLSDGRALIVIGDAHCAVRAAMG
jgi:hypothetical protein